MHKTAGVIGGMGPDTTVDFMAKVIAATPAGKDQDHAHLLVDQNPKVPNRQAALRGDGEDPVPAMVQMARGLEQAGADFLVMPCNTAHAFAPAIRAAVTIPLVSIVDVTVEACRDRGTVGLLATTGCLDAGLYQDAFGHEGIPAVLPAAAELDEIMAAVAAIKTGDTGSAVAGRLRTVADALVARGAQVLVAACTEIPLVLKADSLPVPLVSSTDVLAEATAALCAGVA